MKINPKSFFILIALVALLAAFACVSKSSALSGSDFKAGRIMDDEVFYNKSSMSVSSIQQFLNSKVPECDTDGSEPSEYSAGTRADYGIAHGSPPPYTCLKGYYENTTTHENNLEGRAIPAGAKSAAQIIWDASQAYTINPQALIVLLQKEEALVLDEWPFPKQYQSATGYGCPDSASCNSQYYGFYNQVNNAAAQFRRYATNPTNYNHVPGEVNSVRWNPNPDCGSGNVFITNQSTASLYNYTPYQPNQAALNNLYGTGDACSSYGNRNFWRVFTTWFGSTLSDFKWTTTGYEIYNKTDSARIDPGKLQPGETYIAKLNAKNTGSAIWYRDSPTPMMLGTTYPSPDNSRFCIKKLWVACNRPTKMQEEKISTGELGHFNFFFKAPFQPGSYRESFKPLAELLAWTNDTYGQELGVKVISPGTFKWTTTGYYVLTEDGTTRLDPGKLKPNTVYLAKLHAYNAGTATWYRDSPTPMVVGTASTEGHSSQICMSGIWISCARPAKMTEASVAPGQLGHFLFKFQTPATTGPYREDFKPLAEMLSWTNDAYGQTLGIVVVAP
jgi:hypothetical protein